VVWGRIEPVLNLGPPETAPYPHHTARYANIINKKSPGLRGLLQSPLTDSNCRPPPYHGGLVPRLRSRAIAQHEALPTDRGVSSAHSDAARITRNGPRRPRTCPQEPSPKGGHGSVANRSDGARDVADGERVLDDERLRSRRPASAGLLSVPSTEDSDECRHLRLVREHLSGHDLGRIRNQLRELLFLRPLGRDPGRVLGVAGGIEQAD
jgi:hypothetical protein